MTKQLSYEELKWQAIEFSDNEIWALVDYLEHEMKARKQEDEDNKINTTLKAIKIAEKNKDKLMFKAWQKELKNLTN